MYRNRVAQHASWAVIAAGGTAGHVLPGISIAEEMVRRGTPASAVHFVGSTRGIETRLVPESGFGLTALSGRGIQRRLTVANLKAVVGLARALVKSFGLLRKQKPEVVVGLGGYASVACGLAAATLRIPVVIVEQNAAPGLANRLLCRFAFAAGCAFEQTSLRRARWTGNPLRPEIASLDRNQQREKARAKLGVPEGKHFIAAFGGSLGAQRINDAVTEALGVWSERSDMSVRHIAGPRNFEEIKATTAHLDESCGYDLVAYESDMVTLYAAADVVVCRAGATTVAELAAVGVPALLVPLPNAPGDHQTANANRLGDTGAAIVVADSELDGPRLVAEVDALLADGERLAAMSRAGASIARPDAASAIVDIAEEAAQRRQGRRHRRRLRRDSAGVGRGEQGES